MLPKGVRLKPEQMVAMRREIEVKIGQAKDVLSACREAGASRLVAYDQGRESLALKFIFTHSNTPGGHTKIELAITCR